MRAAIGRPFAGSVWLRRNRGLAPALMALAAPGLSACGVGVSPLPADAAYYLLRYGPERTRLNYHDRFEADKRALLEQMNQDRAAQGAPPLLYEPRAALVGDAYCLEMALSRSQGHWDPRGRAPYVRWGRAGGVDFHSQNVLAVSSDAANDERPLLERLLEAHAELMAERPPRDSQRQLILDPTLTHVGIGAASVAGQFRMSQEFTRVLFEWVEVPDRPLRAGSVAVVAGQPLPGWRVGEVEVRWQPPPIETAEAPLVRAGGYSYPEVVRRLYPEPPRGHPETPPLAADFRVQRAGRFAVRFPLDQGPGQYVVVCLLEALPLADTRTLLPATAVLIVAVR